MYKFIFLIKILTRNIPFLHKLHLILYKLLIKIIPKKITLNIDQQKMVVKTSDFGLSRRLILFGDHVPAITNFMKNEIKDNMVVIDVGANIGFNTILASKRVGSGKVYAFEPDPRCFELLEENIKVNKYTNTKCEIDALADENGKFSIFLDKKHLSSTTISKNNLENNLGGNSNYGGSIEVNKITLDDYLLKLNETRSIDFLKMNIQGAEGLVIKGAEKTIERSNNMIILTEFWISGLKECGTNPTELLKKIKSMKFELYLVKGLGEGFYKSSMSEKDYTIENLIKFVEDPVNKNHDGMHLAFKKQI